MPEISDEAAIAQAKAHVSQLDLRGWRYDCVGVSRVRGQVGVLFDTFSPSGSLVDGPVIFLVDPETGKVPNWGLLSTLRRR